MSTEKNKYSLAYLVLFAVYGVLSPYLQIMVRKLGYGPAAVGLFLAFFEVVGILGPLVLSRLADATGRYRLALGASLLAVVAALPVLTLVPKPLVTVLSLALLALGLRTMIPVMDAAAVSFSLSERGRGSSYGALRVMGSVGFILMAVAVQLIPGYDAGPAWVMGLSALVPALLSLVVVAILPEPQMKAEAAAATEAARAKSGPRHWDRVFFLGLCVIALSRMAMAPFASFISLYAAEDLGMGKASLVWAISAASEVPLMIVSARIIRRLGAMGSIAVGSVAIVVRLVLVALLPSPAGLMATQALHSLCYGLFQPAAVTFVAQRVPLERRSTGMAIFMGFGVGLPTVLGSALGGFVVEAAGYRGLFLSFTAFAVLALILWAATRRRFSAAPRPEIG